MNLKKFIKSKLSNFINENPLKYFSRLNTHKKMVLNCYKEYMETNDLNQLFRELAKDLDELSIETITTILSRIQEFLLKNKTFLLTKEEAEKISHANFLNKNIVKLGENIYTNGKYYLPVNNFLGTIFIDNYFIEEIEHPEKLKDKAIIDVGAYIGDSALLLSKLTNNNVYGFEPVSSNYEKMINTIKLNNCTNIIPVKQGLGSEEKTTKINVFGNDKIACSLMKYREKMADCVQEEIKTTTLDKYVNENNLNIGLIKVDIEGMEKDFIKGAENTIKTQKPVLLLSVYHTAEDFFTIKPLIDSWNLGYKFKIRKATKESILDDTILIAECR